MTEPADLTAARRREVTTAWHEAAHAVIAVAVGLTIEQVTIVPHVDPTGVPVVGLVPVLPPTSGPGLARARWDVATAAMAASALTQVRGGTLELFASDLHLAREQLGDIDQVVRALRRAARLLRHPRRFRAVEAVTAALLDRKTLTGREVQAIVRKAMRPG